MRRWAAGAASVCFLGFAALQLNDPDPWLWGTLYAVAACSLGSAAAGRPVRAALLAVAGVAVAWAALWVASGPLGGEPMAWGPSAGPLAKEDVREILGLALVATACAGVAAWGRESPERAGGSA